MERRKAKRADARDDNRLSCSGRNRQRPVRHGRRSYGRAALLSCGSLLLRGISSAVCKPNGCLIPETLPVYKLSAGGAGQQIYFCDSSALDDCSVNYTTYGAPTQIYFCDGSVRDDCYVGPGPLPGGHHSHEPRDCPQHLGGPCGEDVADDSSLGLRSLQHEHIAAEQGGCPLSVAEADSEPRTVRSLLRVRTLANFFCWAQPLISDIGTSDARWTSSIAFSGIGCPELAASALTHVDGRNCFCFVHGIERDHVARDLLLSHARPHLCIPTF